MPLAMGDVGIKYFIRAITGNDEAKRHLQNLGFTEGADVMIISKIKGNLIVSIRQSRIAISRQMAAKILLA